MRKATQLIHGANSSEKETGATSVPLVQSTSFAYESAEKLESVFEGREPGFVYSRIGNPTVLAFERRIAALEEGVGAVACSSGMAAITTVMLALAGQGDEIISGNSIFGGTYSLFEKTLPRYGMKTVFVESSNVDAYAEAVNDKTRIIFIETIGNPKMDVPDIAAISKIARENNLVLVVDSTVTTPVLIQPKDLGADIVVHSCSKYINGHGNAIGGAIVDCGTYSWDQSGNDEIREYHGKAGKYAFLAYLRNRLFRDTGCCMAPFNAFLLSMSIESLGVRMKQHCSNALEIASRLEDDKRFREVRFPGLKSHEACKVAASQFDCGSGGILTLRTGSKEKSFEFINSLRLASNLANLGDARTLVIHPASTICRDSSEEARQAMGVKDDLVRFSIGLEDVEDIWEDIDKAL